MQSTEFSFNGIHSYDMGFMNIRIGGSDAKRPIIGNRKANTSKYANKDLEFIQSIEKEPIEIELLIAPTNDRAWTPKMYNDLVSWLVQDEYKEFYSGDDPYRVYYAICTNVVTWEGLNDYGAIPVTFTTNSNHAWSIPVRVHEEIVGYREFEVENSSTFKGKKYYPKVIFKNNNSGGTLTIENTTYGSDEQKISIIDSLAKNDIVVMDNEYRMIYVVDKPTNIYGKQFNKRWFYLVDGINKIKVCGDCEVTMDLQFPIV